MRDRQKTTCPGSSNGRRSLRRHVTTHGVLTRGRITVTTNNQTNTLGLGSTNLVHGTVSLHRDHITVYEGSTLGDNFSALSRTIRRPTTDNFGRILHLHVVILLS